MDIEFAGRAAAELADGLESRYSAKGQAFAEEMYAALLRGADGRHAELIEALRGLLIPGLKAAYSEGALDAVMELIEKI